MQVGYDAGLWSFLSYGRPAVTTAAGYRSTPEDFRREVAQRRQRDAGVAPNMITTPEKFRALIAAQGRAGCHQDHTLQAAARHTSQTSRIGGRPVPRA